MSEEQPTNPTNLTSPSNPTNPTTQPKKSRTSKTKRCGLTFSVTRVQSFLKKPCYIPPLGHTGAIYLAAVIEYIVSEVLEIAAEAAHASKKKRIIPRHVMLTVRRDDELNEFFKNVIFPNSGVMTGIHEILLPVPKRQRAQTDNDD